MSNAKKLKPSASKKPVAAKGQFGRFIREKRLEAGFSEEHVSDYLGTQVSVLRAYEQGEKPIPLNTIYALSNCLDISPSVITQMLASRP